MLLENEQTVNVNHDKCGDTRQRLYYTRKNNKVLYICHNCGYKGAQDYAKIKILTKTGAWGEHRATPKKECRLPADTSYNPTEWRREARDWVYQYGITEEEIRRHRICYSNHMDRVILPCFDGDGLCFYTARSLDAEHLPKYLTYKRHSLDYKPLFLADHSSTGSCIVLTEDILSAIKVTQLEDVAGLSTLGLGMDHHGINFLRYLQPSKVYIFYDNDNAEVKKQTNKLQRRLDMSIDCMVQVIRNDKDPKECNLEELRCLLN